MGPTGTGARRACSPWYHLQKPFAFFSLRVLLINHLAINILSVCSLGEGGRSGENHLFLSVTQEPSPFEPFRVTLEGGGAPVQSCCSPLLHGTDSPQKYFQAMGK